MLRAYVLDLLFTQS